MSLSNKKILISGCGFSWSGQERKTWVNVLRSVGAKIHDVGGPAVSNQWILNKVIMALLDDSYDCVIIQLTSPGKLDVEVDEIRESILVKSDSLRNFTYQGVWPSSHSQEHPAKLLWKDLLYSPRLETEEVFVKIMLLTDWCRVRNIPLIVLQGYDIEWTTLQRNQLKNVIKNIDWPLYSQYRQSEYYQCHDYTKQNTVPCIEYQASLAYQIAEIIQPDLLNKIQKIKDHFGCK